MSTFERIDLAQFDGHTPGPWSWFGNTRYGGFYLATNHSGRIFVMTFERMGMQGAQPLFQVDNVMVGGRDLCRYEVAPNVVGVKAARKSGSGVYREDITEFDHDDARLIAAAPELLAALRAAYAEIDRLQSQLIAVQEDAMTIYGDNDRLTAEIDRLTKRLAIRDSVAQDYVRAMELMSDDMDRLRASALEWVTVTDDINTLPYEQGLVVVVPFDGRPTFVTTRNRNIIPGDRWIPIREVPA